MLERVFCHVFRIKKIDYEIRNASMGYIISATDAVTSPFEMTDYTYLVGKGRSFVGCVWQFGNLLFTIRYSNCDVGIDPNCTTAICTSLIHEQYLLVTPSAGFSWMDLMNAVKEISNISLNTWEFMWTAEYSALCTLSLLPESPPAPESVQAEAARWNW
jgi:hypothetical protein